MIDRLYFETLGKYDMKMDIWGGENLGKRKLVPGRPVPLLPPEEVVNFVCCHFRNLVQGLAVRWKLGNHSLLEGRPRFQKETSVHLSGWFWKRVRS